MEDLVDNVIKINFDEIINYNFPLNQVFGLDINYKGIRFCFIVKFSKQNKNLICCGPGAHSRTSKTSTGKLITPPYFDRWSWYKYFEESFIAYADPIFFKDEYITLGWFVGDKNWYLEMLSDILLKLIENQKIFQNNVLFYGNSGGGFTSVCLGTLIKGSKVLINNAQLFIMNFHESHINHLFRILEGEFLGLSRSEIMDIINYRINTIKLFEKENYIPPIHYYVNTESDEDFHDQCIPFLNELKELPNYQDNLTLFPYKQKMKQPHWPLSTDESVKILQLFLKQYLYNDVEEKTNKLKNNLLKSNVIANTFNKELNSPFDSADCIFYDKGTLDSHNTNYVQNLHVSYSKTGTTVSYVSEKGSKYYRTSIDGTKWFDSTKNYIIDVDFSFERDSKFSSAAIGLGDASIDLFRMFGSNSLKGSGHLTILTKGNDYKVYLDGNHLSFLDQTMINNNGFYFQIYGTSSITFSDLKIRIGK